MAPQLQPVGQVYPAQTVPYMGKTAQFNNNKDITIKPEECEVYVMFHRMGNRECSAVCFVSNCGCVVFFRLQ